MREQVETMLSIGSHGVIYAGVKANRGGDGGSVIDSGSDAKNICYGRIDGAGFFEEPRYYEGVVASRDRGMPR